MKKNEEKYRDLHIQSLLSSGKKAVEISSQMGIRRIEIWGSNLRKPEAVSEEMRVKISRLKRLITKAKTFKEKGRRGVFDKVITPCEDGIREILNAEPYNIEVKEMLIEVLILRQEFEDAVALIEEVLKEDSLNINARLNLLYIYKKQRNTNGISQVTEELLEIENELERIVEEHLEYKDARNDLITIYKKLNRKDKLIELLKRIRAFDKNDILCRIELGTIYRKTQDDENGILVQEEIRRLSPMDVNCRVILVTIYKKRKEFDKVIELQEEIRGISKDDVKSRLELIGLYSEKMKNGKPESEEREALRQQIAKIEDEVLAVESSYRNTHQQHTQDNLKFRHWILMRYKERKDYEKYIEIGEEVLQQDPNDERTIYGLISSYLKREEQDEATINRLIELYNKLNELESNNRRFVNKTLFKMLEIKCKKLQAARFKHEKSDMQETNRQLEFMLLKILDLDANNLKARVALCKIYLEQGRIEEAEKIIAPCAEDDREVIDCTEHLGKIQCAVLKKGINLEGDLNDSQKLSVRIISLEIMMDKYLREGSLIIVRKMADEILKIDPTNQFALTAIEKFNKSDVKRDAPEDPDSGPGGNR